MSQHQTPLNLVSSLLASDFKTKEIKIYLSALKDEGNDERRIDKVTTFLKLILNIFIILPIMTWEDTKIRSDQNYIDMIWIEYCPCYIGVRPT